MADSRRDAWCERLLWPIAVASWALAVRLCVCFASGLPWYSSDTGMYFVLRRFFGLPYRDMDTGFRLMRRSVVEDIAPQAHHLSTFTAEFVVRAH